MGAGDDHTANCGSFLNHRAEVVSYVLPSMVEDESCE